MATIMERMTSTQSTRRTLEDIGAGILRYGLVIILVWIGALKFVAYEAESIQGLVANSLLQPFGRRARRCKQPAESSRLDLEIQSVKCAFIREKRAI